MFYRRNFFFPPSFLAKRCNGRPKRLLHMMHPPLQTNSMGVTFLYRLYPSHKIFYRQKTTKINHFFDHSLIIFALLSLFLGILKNCFIASNGDYRTMFWPNMVVIGCLTSEQNWPVKSTLKRFVPQMSRSSCNCIHQSSPRHCAQPVESTHTVERSWSHRVIIAALSADDHFPLLVKWPGTNYLKISGIQPSTLTASGQHWRLTCLRRIGRWATTPPLPSLRK